MLRTCVGCRESVSAEELVRLVLGPDGSVVPVLSGAGFGRGAWVHARPDCIRQAVPRGVARGLKAEIKTSAAEVLALLRAAAERRVFGLITSAIRARKAAVGSTAVKEAHAAGNVKLLIVATDAKAAAETPWVLDLVRQGRARAFATSELLGGVTSREVTGVIAILDTGIAEAVSQALAIALLPEFVSASAKRDRETVWTEVG